MLWFLFNSESTSENMLYIQNNLNLDNPSGIQDPVSKLWILVLNVLCYHTSLISDFEYNMAITLSLICALLIRFEAPVISLSSIYGIACLLFLSNMKQYFTSTNPIQASPIIHQSKSMDIVGEIRNMSDRNTTNW